MCIHILTLFQACNANIYYTVQRTIHGPHQPLYKDAVPPLPEALTVREYAYDLDTFDVTPSDPAVIAAARETAFQGAHTISLKSQTVDIKGKGKATTYKSGSVVSSGQDADADAAADAYAPDDVQRAPSRASSQGAPAEEEWEPYDPRKLRANEMPQKIGQGSHINRADRARSDTEPDFSVEVFPGLDALESSGADDDDESVPVLSDAAEPYTNVYRGLALDKDDKRGEDDGADKYQYRTMEDGMIDVGMYDDGLIQEGDAGIGRSRWGNSGNDGEEGDDEGEDEVDLFGRARRDRGDLSLSEHGVDDAAAVRRPECDRAHSLDQRNREDAEADAAFADACLNIPPPSRSVSPAPPLVITLPPADPAVAATAHTPADAAVAAAALKESLALAQHDANAKLARLSASVKPAFRLTLPSLSVPNSMIVPVASSLLSAATSLVSPVSATPPPLSEPLDTVALDIGVTALPMADDDKRMAIDRALSIAAHQASPDTTEAVPAREPISLNSPPTAGPLVLTATVPNSPSGPPGRGRSALRSKGTFITAPARSTSPTSPSSDLAMGHPNLALVPPQPAARRSLRNSPAPRSTTPGDPNSDSSGGKRARIDTPDNGEYPAISSPHFNTYLPYSSQAVRLQKRSNRVE